MIFFCLTILLISALKVSTDAAFDKIISTFDANIIVEFSGFNNVGNKGQQKFGCCNLRNNETGICLPCIYVVSLILNDLSIFSPQKFEVKLKIYDSPIESSIEKWNRQRLVDSDTYSEHQISIRTLEPKDIVVEEWFTGRNKEYFKYSYENAYGLKNRIKANFILTVESVNNLLSYRGFQIRIDSINWKNYKDVNSKCCKISSDEMCNVPCEFSIEALLGKYKLDGTATIAENELEKSYGLGAALNIKPFASVYSDPFNLIINIKSVSTYALVDSFIVRNINNIPNLENKIINLVGAYNNVVINLTLTHVCKRYVGNNCRSFCLNIDEISKCIDLAEKKICANGATDLPTCEKFSSTCENTICSNGGKCKIQDKIISCECTQGFTGRFCEKIICSSECNGNGECIGPEKCLCKYPFTGKDCEMSPCNNSFNHYCGSESQCILTKGIPSCVCNVLFKGERCDQPICSNKCVFGHCVYVPKKKITTCHCDQFYEGISCDIFKSQDSVRIYKNVPMFLPPLIIMIFFNVLVLSGIIVVYFKYVSNKNEINV